MDPKELTETIRAARVYLNSLDDLNIELKTAESQILNTAKATEDEIEVIFTNLLQSITKTLLNRKKILIENTRRIRNQSIEPIKSCQLVIKDKLNDTNKLIDLAKCINNTELEEFQCKSSLLGTLPEVPDLKEVTYITFRYETSAQNDINGLCMNFGSVSRIAPIQICTTTEKPGAILVEWESVDVDDRYTEIQEFRLQRAYGNAKSNCSLVTFTDCYIGSDFQYLVKDLNPNQEYSFRICCKFEGCMEWSPWSMIQIASTSIKPYGWQDNTNFIITNESRIVTPINDGVILSDGPQFQVGHTVDFIFLEVDENLKENFVGLILFENDICKDNNLLKDGTFLIETTGDVYIDGSKKSTRLPPIKKGSKVSFMCSQIYDDKIRMNIDISDKRVTYDWNVESCKSLHFIGKFTTSLWKIMVE